MVRLAVGGRWQGMGNILFFCRGMNLALVHVVGLEGVGRHTEKMYRSDKKHFTYYAKKGQNGEMQTLFTRYTIDD